MKTPEKTYLGDSVYAQHDGYHVVLTTENGLPDDPTNTIALEPGVLRSLFDFCDRFTPKLEDVTLPDALGVELTRCLKSTLDSVEYSRNACVKGAKALARVALELSGEVQFNPYGGTFWFTVSKREDVQILMKLAPVWTKNVWENGIDYNANVDGVEFKIRTTDGALPPTCKLVEQEVDIPEKPAVPAHKEMRYVVECSKPVEEPATP